MPWKVSRGEVGQQGKLPAFRRLMTRVLALIDHTEPNCPIPSGLVLYRHQSRNLKSFSMCNKTATTMGLRNVPDEKVVANHFGLCQRRRQRVGIADVPKFR